MHTRTMKMLKSAAIPSQKSDNSENEHSINFFSDSQSAVMHWCHA